VVWGEIDPYGIKFCGNAFWIVDMGYSTKVGK
jgi:hypothetical protein